MYKVGRGDMQGRVWGNFNHNDVGLTENMFSESGSHLGDLERIFLIYKVRTTTTTYFIMCGSNDLF